MRLRVCYIRWPLQYLILYSIIFITQLSYYIILMKPTCLMVFYVKINKIRERGYKRTYIN